MLLLVYKLYELTSISDLLLFYVILFLLTIVIALLISVRYHYSVTPAFNTILCRLKLFTLLARRGILYLQCDDRKGSNSTKVARISGYNVPLIDSAIKPPAMPIVFSILDSSPSTLYFSQLILVPFPTDRKTFSEHTTSLLCCQGAYNVSCINLQKMMSRWIVHFLSSHHCSSYLLILFCIHLFPYDHHYTFALFLTNDLFVVILLWIQWLFLWVWLLFQFCYSLNLVTFEFSYSLNSVTFSLTFLFLFFFFFLMQEKFFILIFYFIYEKPKKFFALFVLEPIIWNWLCVWFDWEHDDDSQQYLVYHPLTKVIKGVRLYLKRRTNNGCGITCGRSMCQ